MKRNGLFWKRASVFSFFFIALTISPREGHTATAEMGVSVVTDREMAPPAAHGLSKLMAALQAKGIAAEKAATLDAARGKVLIVAGLASGSGPTARLLKDSNIPAPTGAEALVIRHSKWNAKPALVVCGSDPRGLMYAELDVADRIGWAADPNNPLSEVRDTAEKPAVVERALSIYTMNRAYFESRLYNEEYWARYFDTLAKNRFNTFVLIFGYENGGYMAPPYPYFFDVEQFPDVRVIGIAKEQQQRNLDALNRLIRMAHERGLNFTLGIWDHIYRGGVQWGGTQGAEQTAKQPTPGFVWGVTTENLTPYTKAALAKLIKLVPNPDAIQFRMHDESGLKKEEQVEFWKNIFQVVKESAPNIRFDARAKGLPDSVIETGLDRGVKLRVTTKYWMEQMGMPFHPTHINRQNQFDRRHSYADLLRYPQRYKMHWRLWNGGTSRVLLWGDPEYVRRFAESTHLYDGEGFEVNEPLTTKMEAQPHDMKAFELLKPQYQYYDYEFERYWHFFQVFGRLGYNPDTPPEIWQKEFERRFGKDAAPFVERGLHRASRILPRIVAACYPYGYFPMTRGWAEKQRLGDLPTYSKNEGSDIQQFASFDEEAQNQIEGKETAKMRPQETSKWFANMARDVLEQVEQAERRIGDKRSKEFNSTMVDLRILANLALYHSRRIPAAVHYALFKRTNDLNALDEAIAGERRAIEAWEELVQAAGDVYADDLMMGVRRAGLCGHWRDEFVELNKGLEELERQRDTFRPAGTSGSIVIAHVPVRRIEPRQDLVVRSTVSGGDSVNVMLGVRSSRFSYYFDSKKIGPFRYQSVAPTGVLGDWAEYFIEVKDKSGEQTNFPGPGDDRINRIPVTITNDNTPPMVAHKPIARAPAGKPLTIAAEVGDPSGVKWVRVLYRSVNQTQDYRVLPMLPTGKGDQYQAEIPAEHLDPKWDFMYLIEVMDTKGNGKIYPDLETETPYVVVRLLQ